MLIRLFRRTGPAEIFLILLIALVVWLSAFFNPTVPDTFNYDLNPMPLYGLLKQLIGGNAFYGVMFSFSLILLMLFLITNFNTTHFFINERTFLPSVIFVLLTGLFPRYQTLNPVLPAAVFLMLAIRRIIDSYRKATTAYNFFDASLLIGTGSLFYANLVWYAIIVFIGIAIFRTGNIKELVISLIGLVTPALITIGIYYIADKDISSLSNLLNNNLFSGSEKYSFSVFAAIALILLGLIILISTVHLLSLLNNKKIKSRNTFTLLIWSLVISLAVYFAVPSSSVEILVLTAIPASYVIAHYLIFSRKKLLPEICFAVVFIAVVFMQIWDLIQDTKIFT
jgi:hypothetical protein